jgi:ubiquinone/menaquinone biosynthesis C-methylase UbiE
MSKQGKNWQKFSGKNIPASLELFPIIFNYINKDDKILDLGCGFGKTCVKLFKNGYTNIYGIDLIEEGIKLSKKQLEDEGMLKPDNFFRVADATKIPFDDNFFNFAISQAFWTSIMPDERNKIIKEIYRVLKKSGYYYIAQFAQTWRLPLYKHRYEEGTKKGYEIGTFENIDKTTGEIKYLAHHYTKDELEKLLKSANFTIIHYSKELFTTQGGNQVDGHVIIARK